MPWYTQSANTWDNALPIGNGRLGAMVYGRTGTELLQLNEDSVWYGGPQDRTPYGACEYLKELRSLIRAGNHEEAENMVEEIFYSTPASMRHVEPLSTIKIEFGHDEARCANYKRSLDLDTAVTSTEYELYGIKYRREMIASWPDEVLALKITASETSRFILHLSRSSHIEYETNEFFDDIKQIGGKLIMSFTPGGAKSSRGSCVVGATCGFGGSVKVVNGKLVFNTKEALIIISGHTTFRHADPEETAMHDIDSAFHLGGAELWRRHIEAYQLSYRRTQVQLGDGKPSDDSSLGPTNERLCANPTPKIFELYHNFGRYLLLSCGRASRKHWPALPANLQGIWSNNFSPAWGCKYTININIQMNYWAANIWNLADCEDPLFEHLERMAARGRTTAKEVYGCRGWCAHHNTDIWADTDPEARWMPATLWPLGGAWLCLHIWERWLYTGDIQFLSRMFPILQEAVRFCTEYLIVDKDGRYLVPFPSLSPENCFWIDDAQTKKGRLCEGSAMDVQIISALFNAYISTVSLPESRYFYLEDQRLCDPHLHATVSSCLERLPPHRISPKHGNLQEYAEDYAEVEPGHRHFSHLFALFPGNTITPVSTPDLADACRITLSRRLQHGGAHTGWSRAWLINLYARLWDSEQCLAHLSLLLQNSTLPNMFDTHPPFQIDGNFGGSAGILEMLIQSHEMETDENGEGSRIIRLLPSCPQSWLEIGGHFKGLRCRDGFEVTCKWKEGSIKSCSINNIRGARATIIFLGGKRSKLAPQIGEHELV